MTSPARIEANRRNAQKSTGPRTAEGKDRVRLNALKHGLDAQTVVLPHEDAEKYEKRREAWTRELSPGGDVGDYLAERAVKLSWQLDRADAAEHAELARRVREIPKERERSRRRRAAELLRRVLADDPDPEPDGKPRPGRVEWLARLESTAHGCRALLEAWDGVSAKLSAGGPRPGGWAWDVELPMLRLLGAADRPAAARSRDPRAARVAAVLSSALEQSMAAVVRRTGLDDLVNRPAPGPFDDAAARAELLAIVAEEQERLIDHLKAHEAEQPDPAAEDAARASFDRSKEGERVHRYQGQWGRALLQTLKAITALRPVLAAPTQDESEAAAPTAAPEQSQADDENAMPDQELRPDVAPRSRPGPAVVPVLLPVPTAAGRIADLDEPTAVVRAPAA